MPAPQALPLLRVDDLTIDVLTPSGPRPVVQRVGFTLEAGRTLCVAGESGSGKSLTALSLMGLLPPRIAKVAAGSARFAGRDLFRLPERAMRRLRGAEIAMIFQEPMTSLNPVITIGTQLAEAVRAHERLSWRAARQRALEALEAVRLTEPRRRLDQYPHELSGGMRQRVMIAIAMACRPKILIADEPTTALDVTIQAQVLDLMRELQAETGMGLILITHDMGVVATMADDVLIMHQGQTVETGTRRQIFQSPSQPYTQALLAAVPRLGASAGPPPLRPAERTPVLRVRDLEIAFPGASGFLRPAASPVPVVKGIGFDLMPGETLAIVGESGSGKSTTARAIMGLVKSQGLIEIDGFNRASHHGADVLRLRRAVQMIFQDPYASLDPRMTVGKLVAEPLIVHRQAKGQALRQRVADLFERVGLLPDHMSRHPHEFSGGQRQRICIARALALSPKIIIADEPVSALDVTVQARIMQLLARLQAELGLAYLFISHDMAVVEQISHRVAVMRQGTIVEIGPATQVLHHPRHAYTQALLAAVPQPDIAL
ncbi:peptide/nickel transport system ATP-binding protein [Arboricoccus pini]|uniref:Peptide/nickel transport system ATP-binding protein n=1 Tax=Arboricoccus pini TaxID=1963835 RepID=A0A212RGS1_9PROT|nr:ABC transporter ATP-binding protein [Arboricoccus pini]SNB71600.1 peptide/nickel transport system ATP-binding protein [Arboricoccus pini]